MKNETWLGLAGVCAASVLVFAAGCGGGGSTPKVDGGVDSPTGMDARADADASNPFVDASADMVPTQDATTPVRLQLSDTSVKVIEGSPTLSMGTFTVSLNRPWSAPITVTLLSANPNVATVIPETIEFPTGETGPVMVTVVASIDDDTVDNTTTLTLSSIETGSSTLAVEVDDMDVQALLATPPRVAMTEGRTETLSVRLAKRPASAVVVTVASSNTAKLTVGTATLTFNAGNYSIPQTIALIAAQDEDAALDNVIVNLTSTGNIPAMPVPVEITDDDAVNLDVTPANLSLMERATTPGAVSVSLTRPPSANVTVMVTSSNTAKATVSPAMLTFTPTNSATAQMVQVTPVADDDSRDEMVMLTFVATGITPAPPSRTVVVAIDDPDSQALQIMPAMLAMTEGTTTTFEVRLTLNPGTSSTVSVFSQNTGKLEVTPPVLTFNQSNFSTPQTVTVKSLQDEDLANDSVTITLTGSAAENVNVPVAVTDDDMQSIQLIPPSPGATLVMQETQVNGPPSTAPVGVRLAFRPAAAVTVLLTSGNSSKLELSRSSLTFSPADYSVAQFVTLTAPHDVDMVDDLIELSATATSPGAAIPLAKLPVEIRDMDVLAFNVSTAAVGPLLEGGTALDHATVNTAEGSEAFTLKLTVVPQATVTPLIELVPAGADTKLTVTTIPSPCVLTGAGAMTSGCEIRVTAREDQDAIDEVATIRISDAAGVIATRTVSVAVDDRDVQGLAVTTPAGGPVANPIVIAEGGTANVKVALTAEPVGSAAVQLTTSLTGPVTFDTAMSPACAITADGRLTTTTPWQTGCVVTITGVQDTDLLEQNLSIRVNATGLGVSDVFVNVRKPDDDMQAVVLSRCVGTTPTIETANPLLIPLTEGGADNSLCVSLMFQPDVTNTVTLTATQMPVALGLTGPNFTVMPSTLMFNNTAGGAGSYNTPQLITIKPLEDENIDSEVAGWDGRITISVTPFANPRTLTINMTDNDTQAILIGAEMSPTTTVPSIPLNEKKQSPSFTMGTSVSRAVKLFKIPAKMQANDTTSTETITVTSSSAKVTVTGNCSGSPTSFSFTNVTASMAQTLTIASCPDDDTQDETATLTLHSDRAGTVDRQIGVTVDDLDLPYALNVAVTGSGGTVSAPTDVNSNGLSGCTDGSGDCAGAYEPQTTVTLTESHDNATWRFAGWSGCLPVTSTAATLNVVMTDTKNCVATFEPRLAVTVNGNGSVESTSPNSGINNCRSASGDCTDPYAVGTMVHLEATADAGWAFGGWTNCSTSSSESLTVTMSQARTCVATFNPILTVTVAGTGTGTVTGAGINCMTGGAGTCQLAQALNSTATLSTTNGTDSGFISWTGSGCAGGTVSMSQPRSCTATFDAIAH